MADCPLLTDTVISVLLRSHAEILTRAARATSDHSSACTLPYAIRSPPCHSEMQLAALVPAPVGPPHLSRANDDTVASRRWDAGRGDDWEVLM